MAQWRVLPVPRDGLKKPARRGFLAVLKSISLLRISDWPGDSIHSHGRPSPLPHPVSPGMLFVTTHTLHYFSHHATAVLGSLTLIM